MKSIMQVMAVATATIVLFFSCGQKTGSGEDQSKSPIAAFTFVSGEVNVERDGTLRSGSSGDRLEVNDLIITGASSSADLAVKGLGVLKISENSRVKVASLVVGEDSVRAEVHLTKGDLASVIKKENKDSDYMVVTPTAVAGVRGTVFLVSVSDSKESGQRESFAVLDGSIYVKEKGSEEEVILSKETELVIEENRKLTDKMVRPLSEKNLKQIRKLVVFHRSNVSEFNTLVEDMKNSTSELKGLEGAQESAERSIQEQTRKQAEMTGDAAGRASEAKLDKHIKRDTEGDPVKIEASESYDK